MLEVILFFLADENKLDILHLTNNKNAHKKIK